MAAIGNYVYPMISGVASNELARLIGWAGKDRVSTESYSGQLGTSIGMYDTGCTARPGGPISMCNMFYPASPERCNFAGFGSSLDDFYIMF